MCIYVLGHMFTRVLFCMAQVYRCIQTLQGICLRMFFFNFSGHMLTRVFRRFAWQPVSCRAHAYVFTFFWGHRFTRVFCFAWHRFTGVFRCCRAHAYMCFYFLGHMFTRVSFCMAQVYMCIPMLQSTCLHVYFLFSVHAYMCILLFCMTQVYMCIPLLQGTRLLFRAHVYMCMLLFCMAQVYMCIPLL